MKEEEERVSATTAEDDPEKGKSGCCGCSASIPAPKLKLPNQDLLRINHRGKVYAYDHEACLTWSVLFAGTGTIFLHRRVWIVVPYVMLVAFTAAMFVFFCIPSARKLDTGRFNDFVNYIKVFIAFMLGLFLNNSFRRWWTAVSRFKKFLTSIKQLMYTLHAVGVREDVFINIERLVMAACYVLNEEVHMAQLESPEAKKATLGQDDGLG